MILTVLATGFGMFSLVMGLVSSDPGARLGGAFLTVVGIAFAATRLFIDKVRVDIVVGTHRDDRARGRAWPLP